jgi:hypothetical protein
MAWLPIYAADNDWDLLLGLLNADSEIAFVSSDGAGRWRAINTIARLSVGRYCLWHVPSGPLPLLRPGGQPSGLVEDPFAGWREERQGADKEQPYFGPGHPGVFWLNVRPDTFGKYSGVRTIGLSSFEWIGNWYRSLGSSPELSTERWWRRLGAWARRHATKVPRGGLSQHDPPEIWALPCAYDLLLPQAALGGNI